MRWFSLERSFPPLEKRGKDKPRAKIDGLGGFLYKAINNEKAPQ